LQVGYSKVTFVTQKSKVAAVVPAVTWKPMCGVLGAAVRLVPELSQQAVLKSVHLTVPEADASFAQ
jgi:hypothetical protein